MKIVVQPQGAKSAYAIEVGSDALENAMADLAAEGRLADAYDGSGNPVGQTFYNGRRWRYWVGTPRPRGDVIPAMMAERGVG